eukprot:1235162-Prymnesium_polylepis.2
MQRKIATTRASPGWTTRACCGCACGSGTSVAGPVRRVRHLVILRVGVARPPAGVLEAFCQCTSCALRPRSDACTRFR